MSNGVWSRHGRGHDRVVTWPNIQVNIFLRGPGWEGLKLHSKNVATETVDRHFYYRSLFFQSKELRVFIPVNENKQFCKHQPF